MVFPLSELIPEIRPIEIVDVGAMSIGEGKEPYANLLKAARCDVIGFEPVAEEIEKLRAAGWAGRTFLPYVIGDGTEHYKDLTTRMSQVLWVDAIFVRDFRTFGNVDAQSLLRLATILHDNYRSLDLAAVALEAYDQQMGTSLHGAYVGRFEQVSA